MISIWPYYILHNSATAPVSSLTSDPTARLLKLQEKLHNCLIHLNVKVTLLCKSPDRLPRLCYSDPNHVAFILSHRLDISFISPYIYDILDITSKSYFWYSLSVLVLSEFNDFDLRNVSTCVLVIWRCFRKSFRLTCESPLCMTNKNTNETIWPLPDPGLWSCTMYLLESWAQSYV